MRSYRLTNDFHRTEATVRPTFDKYGEAILSHRQVLRAQRALCGMSDCMCSAHGARGGEYWIGDNYTHYERLADRTYNLHRTGGNWDDDTIVREDDTITSPTGERRSVCHSCETCDGNGGVLLLAGDWASRPPLYRYRNCPDCDGTGGETP